MTSEKAEYMRQLRADNTDYAARNRNRIKAHQDALRRLRAKYRTEYDLFYAEELEKMRARGMQVDKPPKEDDDDDSGEEEQSA